MRPLRQRRAVRVPRAMTREAVIYARYSPRPDGQECQSCAVQVYRATHYCEMQQWRVLETHEDQGISGKSDARPAFQDALASACKPGRVLVVTALDRFARNARDALVYMEHLRTAGADLVMLDLQIDTTTPIGRFMFTVFAGFAQLEREFIAARTRTAMRRYRQQGRRMSRFAPYGMRICPDDPGRMVPDPMELAAIDSARAMKARGQSYQQIAWHLNAAGVSTRTGRPFDKAAARRLINSQPPPGEAA